MGTSERFFPIMYSFMYIQLVQMGGYEVAYVALNRFFFHANRFNNFERQCPTPKENNQLLVEVLEDIFNEQEFPSNRKGEE